MNILSSTPIRDCIPHISITIDPESDIDCFCFFLTSLEYRRKRSNILNFYSKLAEKIERGENEKEATRDVVSDMYRRFDTKIKDIITIVEKEFSASGPVFTALANYMAFPQLGEKSYTAVPTFLPFSPTNENLFFFSIAQAIAKHKIKPFQIVSIGIHEISHFIFFEQLHTWSQKTGIILNNPSIHYFKEALAAAIMNQPEFRKFFDYPSLIGSDNYPGNSELHQIFINTHGKNENMVTFFEKEILHSSNNYATSINHILSRFTAVSNVIAEKWKLWNSTFPESGKQEEIMNLYSKPINL